jgi:polyphosphate kinase
MRRYFINEINKEIRQARKTGVASMTVKLNSLVDEEMIGKLYEASRDGVDIQMVIRGICCAYTQQKVFKKPPRAISIIDEYLEHARVFIFGSGPSAKIFISSADWMVRNLDHRVEAACPIYDPVIKEELIEIMRLQASENVKGRILDNAQANHYVPRKEGEPPVRSQLATYHYLRNKQYTSS